MIYPAYALSAFLTVTSLLFGYNVAGTSDAHAAVTTKTTWNIRVIPVFDYAMITALPATWPSKPAIKEKGEASFEAVFFPKGETPGKRTQSIVLQAYKGIRLRPAVYAKKTFAAAQQVCGAGNSARQTLSSTEQSITFTIFCGSPNKDLPGKDGLSRKQGEIILYRVDLKDDNLYVIGHSWRGKKFTPDKRKEKTFPVSLETISKHADVLRSAMYCHRERPNESCVKFKKFF